MTSIVGTWTLQLSNARYIHSKRIFGYESKKNIQDCILSAEEDHGDPINRGEHVLLIRKLNLVKLRFITI